MRRDRYHFTMQGYYLSTQRLDGTVYKLCRLNQVFGSLMMDNYLCLRHMLEENPGTTTMVPGLWLYKNAMNYNKMGYACAIGTFLFIVTMGLTFLNMRFVQSSAEFEGA